MKKDKIRNAPRVVVDFQFVDQTMERDRASLMKQIEVCHCMNQKYEKPLKLTTSQSEHPLMKQYVEQRNLNKWGIDLEKRDILDAYPKEQIIYLSGDVDIDMDVYEPEKIYIIGGLVEHNRLTNLTKNYAEKNGITARRLPLSRYLDLKACSLLNINHVFQILLMLHNGASMQKAIVSSVPQRKIGQVYFDTSSDESDNEKEKKEQ
ncbi:hypothetical protein PPERSA_10437 [Pseudocohnilembus persalinus]|uniref:tRNA (guanine(9)-N(1))-methyltransferase n=1 Tax=Pseudocohnilembus persalinus TaxID=266149 RepID=A0A0V0R0U7_PSEPJ|nr:hypothetical protein PPERSA_10437 [Pseudocohnilembus persalinus]|eukprot:KRX08075.1 hypothetical protein PPERSA_10437 [Pseudocohnilembus persalinus]